MKQNRKRMAYIIIGIAVIFIFLSYSGTFGVTAGRLEQDARKSQKIDPSWAVSKSVNNEMGAMLFYNKQADRAVLSIYLNRHGFSYGYFFRSGGSISDIMDGVAEFSYLNNGKALLSMNNAGINRIEFGNEKVAAIKIDPSKPFSVTVPQNCGSIVMYDINGKEIPVTNVLENN